jgi:hypothetical protein
MTNKVFEWGFVHLNRYTLDVYRGINLRLVLGQWVFNCYVNQFDTSLFSSLSVWRSLSLYAGPAWVFEWGRYHVGLILSQRREL